MIIYSIVAGGTVSMAHLFMAGIIRPCCSDLAPTPLICTPIFLPVIKAFGIDPVHFAIIKVGNPRIGRLVGATHGGGLRHRPRQHGAAPGSTAKAAAATGLRQ